VDIFAKRLRETLVAKGMQQIELAKKIGKSQSIVNDYCTGNKKPPIDVLLLICKELGESPNYLTGYSDET